MERQTEPLTQKKWSELTEDERQAIQESWKHTLPEKFDVFFIGDMEYSLSAETPSFPGCIYVTGNVSCNDINVGESSIIDGSVDCRKVNVGGNFIVDGFIDSFDVNVGDMFVCYDIETYSHPIHAADYVCRIYDQW